MNEYGFTKYMLEMGRDGKMYRIAVRVRRLDQAVLGINIQEVDANSCCG